MQWLNGSPRCGNEDTAGKGGSRAEAAVEKKKAAEECGAAERKSNNIWTGTDC